MTTAGHCPPCVLATTEVQWFAGKGRCLVAATPAYAGDILVAERPIVASSPAAAPQLWERLLVLREADLLAIEADWYLAAAVAVTAAHADPTVAAALAGKFAPSGEELLGAAARSDMDSLRAMEALGVMGSAGGVSVRDFDAAISIMRFNGFRRPGGGEGQVGLYDRASMMSHACCPTAEFSFDEGGTIFVRALCDIEVGQEVTISYLPSAALAQSTEMRRLKLEEWLFKCRCERCEWPLDHCRGFCCPRDGCPGVCFMPGNTSCDEEEAAPVSSAPCSLCGVVLASKALEEALDHESRYGFVVEYGDLTRPETAEGLFRGAVDVFRQHWVLAAITAALASQRAAEGAAGADGLASCQEALAAYRAAAFAPWPWLAGSGGLHAVYAAHA